MPDPLVLYLPIGECFNCGKGIRKEKIWLNNCSFLYPNQICLVNNIFIISVDTKTYDR